MNLTEVKEKIYDFAALFFKGATIIWSEQIITKPTLPYVTLKVGSIKRTAFPVEDEDGNRKYHCGTTLEVNLYTRGLLITDGEGTTATENYANTAMSDLNDFVTFIESEGMTDVMAGFDIAIALFSPPRDLSELQNDIKYRYRSMAEFTVTYTEMANGYYGIANMPIVPNSSGGGTEDMTQTLESIEDVEIEELIEE